jgi:hypothetical protein
MYKSTSRNMQGRAERILPKHVGDFENEQLPPWEARKVLAKRLFDIDQQIKALPRNHPTRRTLGLEKQELALQQKELKQKTPPKPRKPDHHTFPKRSFPVHFITVAKKQLSKQQFESICRVAEERARAEEEGAL